MSGQDESSLGQLPNRRRLTGWLVIALAGLATVIALDVLAPMMAPVKPGTLDDFWTTAWHGWGFGAHEIRRVSDTIYVYEIGGYHGSDLYAVDAAAVDADFPRAYAALLNREDKAQVSRFLVTAIEEADGKAFASVWELKDAEEAIRLKEDPSTGKFSGGQDVLFQLRWAKAQWYGATFLFELIYFVALAAWIVRPWMMRRGPLSWAVHVGLVPLLLALPTYLGYASMTFTTRGPSGGVLYPWIAGATLSGGSMNALDTWLLNRVPPLLYTLTQDTGSAMVLSGRGLRGPTVLLLVGAVAGGVVAAYVRYARSRHTPLQCDP